MTLPKRVQTPCSIAEAWLGRGAHALTDTVSACRGGDIAGGVRFRVRDLPDMMMLTSFRNSRSRRRSFSFPEKNVADALATEQGRWEQWW
jgi:hypothetical protein